MRLLKGKVLLIALLFIAIFTLDGCRQKGKNTLESVADRTELVVAMDIDMPGYFVLADENFGYQYDLLTAYADDLGMELKVITGNTYSDCVALVRSGQADIMATISSGGINPHGAIPIYKTSYVVVASPGEARRFSKYRPFSLSESMDSKRLLISSGFKTSNEYSHIMDSLDSTQKYISSRSSLEMMESLREGEYDYLICERSEAQLGSALVKGVVQVYDFMHEMSVNIALSPQVEGLQEDFEGWLEEYTSDNEYALLNNLYFERGIVGLLNKKAPNQRVRNGISIYDKVMREVCESEGLDWRLISAIAYSESRFNAHVTSHKGARGLMQIMPATARQFNVSQEDVMKPEVNILVAIKLLDKIESTLKLPRDIAYEDRMSIVLACYNCGIGHVLDARRLAAKYGGNPNAWSDVSLFLQRKAQPEYNGDAVVKCGRFSGSKQTLAFVSDVMGRYTAYCSTIKK